MFKDEYNKIPELQRLHSLFDLKNKVAVIVGGAGKMGQQFASTLGFAGARVIIADVDKEKSDNLAKEISSRVKTVVKGFKCDVVKEKQVKELFKTVHDEYGQIDALIYNVMAKPGGYYKPFGQYQTTAWKKVLDGNLTGAFLCCREVADYMKLSNGGSIVLTSSIYGVVGPDQRIYKGCSPAGNIYGDKEPLNCPASYSASKAGLLGLAKYLATLLGEYNIRVNLLTPGGVYDGQEEPFHNEYVNRTPLRRMAVWSDFNGAILFLVSDASRYMTGANLVVDGGWTAW